MVIVLVSSFTVLHGLITSTRQSHRKITKKCDLDANPYVNILSITIDLKEKHLLIKMLSN